MRWENNRDERIRQKPGKEAGEKQWKQRLEVEKVRVVEANRHDNVRRT